MYVFFMYIMCLFYLWRKSKSTGSIPFKPELGSKSLWSYSGSLQKFWAIDYYEPSESFHIFRKWLWKSDILAFFFNSKNAKSIICLHILHKSANFPEKQKQNWRKQKQASAVKAMKMSIAILSSKNAQNK